MTLRNTEGDAMKVGYARVSSTGQSLDVQLDHIQIIQCMIIAVSLCCYQHASLPLTIVNMYGWLETIADTGHGLSAHIRPHGHSDRAVSATN